MKEIFMSTDPVEHIRLDLGEPVLVHADGHCHRMIVSECRSPFRGCSGCSVFKLKERYTDEHLSSLTCEDLYGNLMCGDYIFVRAADIMEDL
jgi:hypothetical protein